MPLMRHILFASLYLTAAVLAAFALPFAGLSIDPLISTLIGGQMFLLGALLHEIYVRGEVNGALTRRYSRLQRQTEELERQVARLNEQQRTPTLGEAATQNSAGPLPPGMAVKPPYHNEVIAEVSIVQDLVDAFSGKENASKGRTMPVALSPGAGMAGPNELMPHELMGEGDKSLADLPELKRKAPISAVNSNVQDQNERQSSTLSAELEGGTAARIEPAQRKAGFEAQQTESIPPALGQVHKSAHTPENVLSLVRRAIEQDRIDVFLQPIVSLPQRKHRYYEVFSRIRAADKTYLRPEEYLAIAEREGLIGIIDNLLLMRCLQLIRETERRHFKVGFFINLSAHSLGDASFMRKFLDFMAHNPELPPKLVFELHQTALTTGGPMNGRILDGLAQLGFRFSMDNVDSLNIDMEDLERRNVRFIKLEAERLLQEQAQDRLEPMRDLLRRANEHGVDVIVEKLESEGQLVTLLDLKIDYGQGYLFGEPRLNRRR
jgi:cyclic-di-GMP phosphodiesterase, flagellum assembly factor TipF